MDAIKLLIVDDRDIIRDGLKLMFNESTGIKVEGEAEDGERALNLIKANDYDVVLMDIMMPKVNGVIATKNIIEYDPGIKILANSFFSNPYQIKELVEAGASGFIKKNEPKEIYIEAIKTIHNGGIFLSNEISYKIYDKVLEYLK